MKIAYRGQFLKECLQEEGHTLLELAHEPGLSLKGQLDNFGTTVDLVLLELYGGRFFPDCIDECGVPLAGYFIDTPINEFWLKHLAPNLDFVFVDQLQSVKSLARYGIKSAWLPLPAQKSFFQPARKKIHDLTFIGTVDGNRLKRKNLLALVKTGIDINVMSGIPIHEAQKVFAESKIILNENFFPGLTLRVLQGMAAGTIVFTERSPYGHNFGFIDRQDLVYYDSGTILPGLKEILTNYEKFSEIALKGQTKCASLYGSERTVGRILARVGNSRREVSCRPGLDDYLWNEAYAEFLFRQRFGGQLKNIPGKFQYLIDINSDKSGVAHVALGDFKMLFDKTSDAQAHYLKAIEFSSEATAYLRLALLKIRQDNLKDALKFIEMYGNVFSTSMSAVSENLLELASVTPASLLALIAEVYLNMGKTADLGFQKAIPHSLPETALEAASLSWSKQPNLHAMRLMLKCLEPYHLQGELLPRLLQGISLGLLSDDLMLQTARLAHDYYDHDTASTILTAMKKAAIRK